MQDTRTSSLTDPNPREAACRWRTTEC